MSTLVLIENSRRESRRDCLHCSTEVKESSSYIGSAAGTPAISSTTSPDFKSAAPKFAATTGTLPTPRSPDSRSAGTNVQTTEREEYTYIALSGESLTPPVTSRPGDSSHLLSRRDSASQQRMLKTPMSTLQLSQAKGVCRSEISINRADPRDIQVAQGQPKTRSPSFDDMYVNHQSETYRNFPAHAHKGNTRSPNLPPYANSNIRPHQPPLANSTVYNSLNSLDGTYTHLKHVNPPERVIDNVYDG
ncbi:uncharacterized protein LOC131930496 [Physella acuta]|uniref:uncharacterized protein LOC131930496 n=1 Tax=Physella acuta TaxID=109671 RepID=UPI0027DCEB57|nr:uncharacterized protein LOC131930496 [Physella acuta]